MCVWVCLYKVECFKIISNESKKKKIEQFLFDLHIFQFETDEQTKACYYFNSHSVQRINLLWQNLKLISFIYLNKISWRESLLKSLLQTFLKKIFLIDRTIENTKKLFKSYFPFLWKKSVIGLHIFFIILWKRNKKESFYRFFHKLKLDLECQIFIL